MVFCDIKPENVILDKFNPKVCDSDYKPKVCDSD